jgi:hypothetical protein
MTNPPSNTNPKRAPAIARYRLKATRSVEIYYTDDKGQPDTTRSAYFLKRVEVGGKHAYLRVNSPDFQEFNVTVVQLDSLLIWGDHPPLAPKKSQLSLSVLGMMMFAIAVLWFFAWIWLPQTSSWQDYLMSRYALATLILLVTYIWNILESASNAVSVDLSNINRLFQYKLKTPPSAFAAGSAKSVAIGADVFHIFQGKVTDVLHWLHPGPNIDDAHPRPQSRFRFTLNGMVFEGFTNQNDFKGQPFIVSGDTLRVAAQSESIETRQVIGFANLSDGNMLINEADERVSSTPLTGAAPMIIFFLLASVFCISWIGFGPPADKISSWVFACAFVVAVWWAVAFKVSQLRRKKLAAALGSHLDDLLKRAVCIHPMAYYFEKPAVVSTPQNPHAH